MEFDPRGLRRNIAVRVLSTTPDSLRRNSS